MHLRRHVLALALLASFPAAAAVVYKWTDSDGVVHFSDQPVPGSERIVTSGGASNGISTGAPAVPNTMPKQKAASVPAFSTLAIDSPAKDQVFFNDDVVSVRLHVEPGLLPTQTVTWNLNGQVLTDPSPTALSFDLQTLPRGIYVIAATVTDSANGASQSTDSVTFYVKQPSELAPQHKKS